MSKEIHKLYRVGNFPKDHFRPNDLNDLKMTQYPIQLFFAGYSFWCKKVNCMYINSPRGAVEFIINGSFELEYGGNTYRANAGDLIILPSNVQAKMTCISAVAEKYVLSFKGVLLIELFSLIVSQGQFVITPYDKTIWENIIAEAESILDSATHDPIKSAMFSYKIILELNKMSKLHQYPTELQDILYYIDNHLQLSIRLNDLVKISSTSQANIYRLFKKHIDKSPLEYIKELRLKSIAELLLTSSLSIKEIADLYNFSSPQLLTKEFKRAYDLSPKEFRKK